MSERKMIIGPIIGMVDDKKAKIGFFGNFGTEGDDKPRVYVFKKTNTSGTADAQFDFFPVSTIDQNVNGLPCNSYLAEIQFPPGDDDFYFRINTQFHSERMYPLKRVPNDADLDFSFGLSSCHKALMVFPKDEPVTTRMWTQLYDQLTAHGSRFHLQVGDQTYCDYLGYSAWDKCQSVSNFDERLAIYRDVYVQSWGFPAVQKVLQTFPQYMIWDDHDITDGWGSLPIHRQKFEDIFEVARQAYIEFQHCHNPNALVGGELFYSFFYGHAAFLVMDLRGHRDIDRRVSHFPLAGKMQWEAIDAWFQQDRVKNSKILFVITSVPPCHLSRSFGSLGFLKMDIADQWSVGKNKAERRMLFNRLFQWQGEENKPAFILAGDAHVGTEATINLTRNGQTRTIYQITSSPITNKPEVFLDFFTALISSRFSFHLDEAKTQRAHVTFTRRHRKRNFAIIEVRYTDGKPRVKLSMYRDKEKLPREHDYPIPS
ncbi:MAG: alkaline phosphatase D family protein [Candidatus Omnitrophota bacterium]